MPHGVQRVNDAPNSMLAARKAVTVLAQASCTKAGTLTLIGANALKTVLRKAVHKTIVPLKTTARKHADLTATRIKTAETLLRKQFSIHTSRQWLGHKRMVRFVDAIIMRPSPVCVFVRVRAVPVCSDVRLFARSFVVCVSVAFFILTVVINDGAHHGQPKKCRNRTGGAVIVSESRSCGKGRHRQCCGGESTHKAGGKREAHLSDPFCDDCGTVVLCCGMGSIWSGLDRTGNNMVLLSDNRCGTERWILYISAEKRILGCMKHIRFPLYAVLLVTLSGPAFAADCYADYKAKQDNPLRLHYGVAEISGQCSKAAARTQLKQRLGARGWKLLNVVSVFGPDGLAQRKDSAGSNFLRF
jgi:hypothetical protein